MKGVYLPLLLRLGLDMWLARANGMSENVRQIECHKMSLAVRFVLCIPSFLHEDTMHPGGWETCRAKLDPAPCPGSSPGKPSLDPLTTSQLQVCQWEISAYVCLPVRSDGCLSCSNITANIYWDKRVRKGLGFWTIQFWLRRGSSFLFASVEFD